MTGCGGFLVTALLVPVCSWRASGCACTSAKLIEYCAVNLASYKVPREIRYVTSWPMSATKIQKFRLRELLGGS